MEAAHSGTYGVAGAEVGEDPGTRDTARYLEVVGCIPDTWIDAVDEEVDTHTSYVLSVDTTKAAAENH